jgi:hypothetical protein
MYKISEGAAGLLIKGWYSANEFSAVEADLFAKAWLKEAGDGEVFELGCAILVRRTDGIYVAAE